VKGEPMNDKSECTLELSVYFNDRLLQVVVLPLSGSIDEVPTSKDSSPLQMILRLIGDDQALAALRGGREREICYYLPKVTETLGAEVVTYHFENHVPTTIFGDNVRCITYTYDAAGKRFEPPIDDKPPQGNLPDEPNIIK
jgi:hypothetical protein